MLDVEAMAESQKVVVFGAAGGVGSALCRKLVAAGHLVHAVGRNRDTTSSLADEIGATYSVCDATEADAVWQVVVKANEILGGLDGVANCVGSLHLKPGHLTSPEEWNQVVSTNLSSSFFVLRASAPLMRRSGGSIVFVSSAAARVGLANHEAIAAAKAGVIGLTLSAAATYSTNRIRVNCVAPGLVDTALAERLTSNARSLEASVAMHALGRIGRPDDIASAIEWLLDERQSWVTGQVLGVDGGLGSVRSRG